MDRTFDCVWLTKIDNDLKYYLYYTNDMADDNYEEEGDDDVGQVIRLMVLRMIE